MRWIIGLLAALSLVCLWRSLALLFGAAPDSTVVLGHSVSTEVFALGIVYLGVFCERLAVALGFFDSRRMGRARWSLVMVCLCLLVVLNSLFFALRLRGLLPQRWMIADLPPEEVTPVVEAALLAPAALVYALLSWLAERLAASRRERLARPATMVAVVPALAAEVPALASEPAQASPGPVTPPLPLPAATT